MCAAGASYGGFMINYIQGHNDIDEEKKKDWKFRCLANHDGVFSAISMFYGTEEVWFPKEEFCPKDKVGCNPFDPGMRDGYEKFSPERFVKNWNTPMMIFHGGIDYRVPLTEGLSSFTALQMRGVESKFFYMPRENHWVLNTENQIAWFEEIYKFFEEHTKEEKSG